MKSDALALLDQAAWPALLVDGSGRINRANQQAATFFGQVVVGEGPLLASIWAPGNPARSDQFVADLARSHQSSTEIKFLVKGGQTQNCSVLLASVMVEGQRFTLFQIPPTAPAQPAERAMTNPLLETSLVQKQKLDCALQLARSVALDFNNALTIILGHASLMLAEMEPDNPLRRPLIEMERSAERAAEISADLADFSRQDKENKAHAAGNLNILVRQTAELFQARAGSAIEWFLELEPRLFTTHVDEAKIQQALVRVVENAAEALEGKPGSIHLISRNVEVPAETPETSVRLAPGHYVCIEVRDSGCGIPQETLGRIFEPFFSTKRGHRGLGLAWVYGIITNHGGSIGVTSAPEAGTGLQIFLPATKRMLPDSGAKGKDLRGHETVMIVDDEELILTLGETVLTTFGYQVLTASSGLRAIQLLQESPNPIELVVTDMVMPAMSGRELIEKLRQISPQTRILCSSGYVRPTQTEDDLYLQKPFTSQQLLVKVRQALNSSPGDAAG